METIFWNCEGCILVNFLENGEMINAAYYVQTLNKLCHALHEKHPKRKLSSFNMTMQGLTAHQILQTIQKNGWELLSHPPYSPNLAPSDHHLFEPLKDHLRDHHYVTDEALQKAMQS